MAAAATTTAKLTLYGSLLCQYAQRVRAALEHLHVPFDYEEVDLLTSQQLSEWYTAINPCQKVPTIKHGDSLVFESLVVLDYLQDAFGQQAGGASLFPADFDAVKRAHVRMWVRVFEDRVVANSFKLYTLFM